MPSVFLFCFNKLGIYWLLLFHVIVIYVFADMTAFVVECCLFVYTGRGCLACETSDAMAVSTVLLTFGVL